MDGLSEDERKALRGSKFAPLPPHRPQQPRLAHPGGPLKTNKAAALAKFLERKLQDPNGLASFDPDIIELAVKNAKGGTSKCGTIIRHTTYCGDTEEPLEEERVKKSSLKKQKRKKKEEREKKKSQR